MNRIPHWRAEAAAWGSDPEPYLQHGNRALEQGQPPLAYEIFNAGLFFNPLHSELGYRTALALARCRSTQAAIAILKDVLTNLSDSDPMAADVYSLAGRLAKDNWEHAIELEDKFRFARESIGHYRHAYRLTGHYYPGINAASMSMLMGDRESARQIASQVKGECLKLLSAQQSPDCWIAATLGETWLLLGDQIEARSWYLKAREQMGRDFGNLASMRRQVRLLKSVIAVDDAILEALAIPQVAAFTGHMIDSPRHAQPRFPSALEVQVRKAIDAVIDKRGIGFGYVSAACGADLLFIEAMLERGAEVHVMLPFRKEDFIQTSVAPAGAGWVKRFEAALDRVAQIHYATDEGYLNDDLLFDYCASLLFGMCLLRAEQLATDPVLVSVLEPKTDIKVGGAMANCLKWLKLGYRSELIDLAEIRASHLPAGSSSSEIPSNESIGQHTNDKSTAHMVREIKAMLFADMVGFSKLGEEAAPSFFVHFLKVVAQAIDAGPVKPVFRNTWGDGLFLVYNDIEAAADAALRLRDAVRDKNWEAVGLPKETNIRIGMHAGPVYSARDPIIDQVNFYGSHVNRAARIEPITTPGTIFVSEQAACLLTLPEHQKFICEYLGHMDLAKQFGSGVLYRLRRLGDSE